MENSLVFLLLAGMLVSALVVTAKAWGKRTQIAKNRKAALDEKERMESIDPVDPDDIDDVLRDGDF